MATKQQFIHILATFLQRKTLDKLSNNTGAKLLILITFFKELQTSLNHPPFLLNIFCSFSCNDFHFYTKLFVLALFISTILLRKLERRTSVIAWYKLAIYINSNHFNFLYVVVYRNVCSPETGKKSL